MNAAEQRQARLAALADGGVFDLIVIGGGVTGAGVFNLATALGLKCLLLEQHDYASGTSSRSSKMVHGGLRYLAKGQLKLARESVREREALLKVLPGLVERTPFIMGHYAGEWPSGRIFRAVLKVYDHYAGARFSKALSAEQTLWRVPGLALQRNGHALRQASVFSDAMTDDARLVLRLLQGGWSGGGESLNYCAVTALEADADAVRIEARAAGHSAPLQLRAHAAVNATGAWADAPWHGCDNGLIMRPLRGSHLVVPAWRLPVYAAVTFTHPEDKRPVMVYPWLGHTLIGTTDVEHRDGLAHEPRIGREETDYLLRAVDHVFPHAGIRTADITSSFAGVRPVIDSGRGAAASDEKREHRVVATGRVVHIAGGKLTTFRPIAREALGHLAGLLPLARAAAKANLLLPLATRPGDSPAATWLGARLGAAVDDCLATATDASLERIADSPHRWAELIWAAQHEQVVHLEDLLLRRTRIGNLLPDGAAAQWPAVRRLCQNLLGWDDAHWQQECAHFRTVYARHYAPPEG